jgi:hypothetical protein
MKHARSVRPALTAAALAVSALFATAAHGQAAAAGAARQGQEVRFASNLILVAPKAGLSEKELDKALGAHGGRREEHWRELNVHFVRLPAGANALQVAAALARNPNVKFAQADILRKVEAIPNDPAYASAWHLPKINAPQAWDRTQGEGITVAVCDSGVDPNHADLVRVPGYNFYDGNTDTRDVYGHGTKVAGAVAMAGNNATGGAGVAYRTRIMPGRVTDSNGWGYDSAIANCITYAANNGARGAVVSFGGVCGSSIIQSAAKYMRDRGGVVVASSGNTGTQQYLGASDLMTCVGATNSSDARTSWSTFGDHVDVVAPGEGIYTTTSGGGYGGVSGTSFSAPVTLGVYALMMAANPSLTPAALDNALFSTAKDLGTAGKDMYHGHGRIDAYAAVAKALGTVQTDTTPPAVAIQAPITGAKLSGVVPVDVSATDAGGVAKVELWANNKLVAVDAISPYGFSWDTSVLPDGTATLFAKAIDAAGNIASSTQVSVTVANDKTSPVAQIQNPAPGATVSGTVSVSASATDNQKVTKMTMTIDGREVAVAYGSSISYAWSTGSATRVRGSSRKTQSTTATVSSSTITVVAEDAAGNKGTASSTVLKQ